MDQLRLLMTTDAVGGVWRYSVDLAKALASRGIQPILVALGPVPDDSMMSEVRSIPDLQLIVTGLPLDWTAQEESEIAHGAHVLASLASEVGANVLHFHSPAFAAYSSFDLPIVVSCHSCVATWWHAVRGPVTLPQDFAWRCALIAEGCKMAHAVIAPTRAHAEATALMHQLHDAPRHIHNGRSIAPSARSAAPSTTNLVVTAGRLWDEAKNIMILDRAAPKIAARVVAAGPQVGPNGAAINPRNLCAIGWQPERAITRMLEAKPIFVSPALYEPFGLAVLEAAQAGCPLVLSDIATFRELWDGAAEFVPARDDIALAAAVNRLLCDATYRITMGAAARKRAQRYTMATMMARHIDIYHALTGRARLEAVA